MEFLREFWWALVGGAVLVGLIIFLIVAFAKNKQNDSSIKTAAKKQQKAEKKAAKKDVSTAQPEQTQAVGKTTNAKTTKAKPVEKTSKTETKAKPVEKTKPTAKTKTEVAKEKAPKTKTETVETKPASKTKATYRVSYSAEDKSWQVKKDGAERVSRRFSTKEEATKWVKTASINQGANIQTHKKDGKFQKKQ